MATEFTVNVENQPGTLASLGEALGKARVNINAIHGMPNADGSLVIFQLLPDDPQHAAEALQKAGFTYTTREVLIVNVLDAPGTLGDVALVMAHAGINIDAVYITTKGQVVLGVDDLDGAIQVAAGMAVMK
jgi:hypothetical protein